ncbi:MAG: UTP--glucose-1-phosphate uridylyltransferase, partial [Nitrospinae bacterium]|nr:UTP--glucose-1-phosphate uridylyltransferase [Nitrospinota bacterium]
MAVTKAILPVAGMGTRFLPATKSVPKEMLPLVDKPLIQYAVEEALASGIKEIILITAKGKQAIEDHFDRSLGLELLLEGKEDAKRLAMVREITDLLEVVSIRQKKPHGLGHAIALARDLFGPEPFAVMLPDDIYHAPHRPALRQLLDVFEERGQSVMAVEEVPRSAVSSYGIVAATEATGTVRTVTSMVEKPAPEDAPSNLAITGRYVFSPELFDYLARTAPDAKGEIQLTAAMNA